MKNDNKLIAEFMGAKPLVLGGSTEYEMYGVLDCIEDGENEKHYFIDDEMRFHESWDWLMPVVEKIESLGYEFTIVENRCKVSKNTVCSLCHHHSVEELFHIETIGSKLDTTYDAVVQFINQYNN